MSPESLENPKYTPNSGQKSPKDFRFWAIFAALFTSVFLGILELYAVSTALPTIVNDLNASEFIWFGSAYTLTSTAFLPFSGGLADAFGRRPILLASLAFFALGGALGGASQSMAMLIAARAIQGVGAGGIFSLTQIILSDMITLEERGVYSGLLGLAWASSASVGPIVGGAFTHHSTWRWLFYINVPIAALVGLLVIIFMKLPQFLSDIRHKLLKMDLIGNAIVIGSTTSIVFALTVGGVQYSWKSFRVLVPLCVGSGGLILFMLYETLIARDPMVPITLINNRTSISGYLQLFLSTFVISGLLCYMPIYFQACHAATPIVSGVDLCAFTLSTSMMTVVGGLSITRFKRYCPQVRLGWILAFVGMALLSRVTATTSRGTVVGFEILAGVGLGTIFSTMYFPVLASVPVTKNAPALSFYAFVRSLAQAAGLTIGGTILQNELSYRLPPSFAALFENGASLAFVRQIPSLPSGTRQQVQVAVAESLSVMWLIMTVMCAMGFAVSLFMQDLSLHSKKDDKWSLPMTNESDSRSLLLPMQEPVHEPLQHLQEPPQEPPQVRYNDMPLFPNVFLEDPDE